MSKYTEAFQEAKDSARAMRLLSGIVVLFFSILAALAAWVVS